MSNLTDVWAQTDRLRDLQVEVEQKDPFEKNEAALSYFSWILQLHSERIRRTIEVQGSQEKRAVGSEVSTVGCFTEAGKMPKWSTAAQLSVNVELCEESGRKAGT